ncbi:DUF5077 domain-containing protein [Undibacterium sp. LX15W]|uniref:DUF5077 domain-containing protein n=2 Tax=Undibacterium flavidum TaxID=2762297 RepID=A0ABR6YCJ3_9BURK|nr:DUF5077 domain-containing protein [Undibacterium flavidum]
MAMLGCGGQTDAQKMSASDNMAPPATTYNATVNLAGNAFITSAAPGAGEIINDSGLANWTSSSTITSMYFRLAQTGQLKLGLVARLSGSTASTVKVSINGTAYNVNLSGSSSKTYDVGTINITAPGYVKVDLQGVSKNGGYFGDVSAVKIAGTAATSGMNFADDAANYYWSRRGPSVNFGYSTPANTEYFYNEMTVPTGEDKIGSYFMANGFSQGYMGIQVKSTTERWILFSVWDADNGGKTTLVRKGAGVVDNSFGGEGTGGQSYLVYNWLAGNTYKFITRAIPDGAGSTLYSAWFYAPETATWRFIATWKRPSTTTYLTGNHSFLENFIDTNGYLGRKVLVGNQWARNTSGVWSEVTQGQFNGDATAANKQRMDFAGGLENGKFYMRNGGFFANYVALGQTFNRPATGIAPSVNVTTLP